MSDVEFDTDAPQAARTQALYAGGYSESSPNPHPHNKALMVGIIIACLVITAAVWLYASRQGTQADSVPWQVKMERMQSSPGFNSR